MDSLNPTGVVDAPETRPALLVSYVYLKAFLRGREEHRYHYRDWVLDSGAFSAHHSGAEIKLQDYIDRCKQLMASDPKLTEIFALDVIGDWKASTKNCAEMWRQGVRAIPCFHAGTPESELKQIAKDYPKIALGGAVGYRGKDKWAQQCFARVWPKAIHGFGFGSEKSIMLVPWHSVDATNWEIGPCKFGRCNAFGDMSVRGSKQNLRAEVEWYLALEKRARQKWKVQMGELARSDLSLRLAISGGGRDGVNDALKEPGSQDSPTLRLAMAQNGGGSASESERVSQSLSVAPAGPSGPTVRLACVGSAQGEVNGDLATEAVRDAITAANKAEGGG